MPDSLLGPLFRRLGILLVLAVALSGCATGPDPRPLVTDVDAPPGAVPPKGFDEIRVGMTRPEVMRILRPHHTVQTAADSTVAEPYMDFLTYVEDGETRHAEIFYDGPQVYAIRFGYADQFVIE